MVSNRRYDWGLHNQATSRRSVSKVQRSDHRRDPGTGSRARKVPYRKGTSSKSQSKERQGFFLSLVLPVIQHHRSVLVEVKTDDGQTYVHATVWGHTYMQPLSVGMMAALVVEPSSVGMMAA